MTSLFRKSLSNYYPSTRSKRPIPRHLRRSHNTEMSHGGVSCGISVMVSGVQYDLGLHGAVEQLLTPDTGWREAASEGCGKKFPPSDCKKLSILLFTTWQLIEIDNALHCFTFTRNLLLTFVFCPTYSTALGFFNLDITLILTKTLLQKGIKTGCLHLN